MENLSGQGKRKKRLWTEEEDQKLRRYMEGIKEHEQKRRGFWGQVPKLAGLNRSGKSCGLRWTEHLERSGMKKGKFSIDEDNKIIELQANKFHGENKWSDIAKELPGRTSNEIKNRWHNHMKKKLLTPTHTPVVQPLIAATGFPISGFGYNITPNPLEPQLRNGFPLPSQGPSGFNNLTMEDQFGPSRSILNNAQVYNNYAIDVGSSTASVPNTGSISNPQIYNNHPVDVSSIPAEDFDLWDISELHGLGFNSTGPAQVPDDSNYYRVFDSSSTIPGQPGIPISGFIYNITPNPLEPHLRNGFPLPSQGPNSFNNLTMEDQFGPSRSILNNPQVYNNYAVDVGSSTASVPNTGSISNPQIYNNHLVDVSSIPAEESACNLWDISEPHGLGFNSTGPAQVPDDSNYHVFDSSSTIPGQPGINREELITLEEKACLEFAEQLFMNDDDTYTDDLSDDKLDSWMKALGSCLNPL